MEILSVAIAIIALLVLVGIGLMWSTVRHLKESVDDLKKVLLRSKSLPYSGPSLRGGAGPELSESEQARQARFPKVQFDVKSGTLPAQARQIPIRAGRSTEVKEQASIRRHHNEIDAPSDKGQPYPPTHPSQPAARAGGLISEQGE